jgi:hypothetical protein
MNFPTHNMGQYNNAVHWFHWWDVVGCSQSVEINKTRKSVVDMHFEDTAPSAASYQTLRKSAVLLLCSFVLSSAKFTTLYIFRTAHARGVFFSVRSGAVVSQDHSAVSVSTVRLGVQLRQPKGASPPHELEIRATGGRANF